MQRSGEESYPPVRNKIRVLVVDDSAFIRTVVSDMLNSYPDIEVIATARNGEDALEKILQLRPDVITLDIEMPRLDGISTLKHIMKEFPTPVIMLSAHTRIDAQATIKSLELGAVDFVPKPSGEISLDISRVMDNLISKVRTAANIEVRKLDHKEEEVLTKPVSIERERTTKNKAVVIGASTGGPRALIQILAKLPADIETGIIVVQHMPPGFTRSLAERLNERSQLEVKEATEGDTVLPGRVLVAPGNYHLEVTGRINEQENYEINATLNQGPLHLGVRPAVDITMASVAEVYGSNSAGVILTGMGRDGTEGIREIKRRGGRTIAQDRDSCVVFGMPKSAIASGQIDKVVPLDKIATEILRAL